MGLQAHAQLNKGTWVAGAGLGLASSGYEFAMPNETDLKKASLRTWGFSPRVGYFMADRLVAGLMPTISFERVRPDDGNTMALTKRMKQNAYFDIGPFLRYYFLDKKTPLNVYGEALYQFGNDSDRGIKVSTVGGEAGIAYLCGKKCTINLSAAYRHRSTNGDKAEIKKAGLLMAQFSILFHSGR